VANILWADNGLIVTSPTLPVGTPVILQVTNLFDGSMHLSGPATGRVFEASQLLQQDAQFGCHDNSMSNLFTSSFQVNLRQTYDVCSAVGAHLSIEIDYESQIQGQDGSYSATADMLDTAGAYIDSLTPGVTISSTSGVNYATPSAVPEPSTSWLCGLGLVGLAAWRLRRCRLSAGERYS
jgi:hypothetical protein